MILAGDVGGTNSRFSFFELVDGALRRVAECAFASGSQTSLERILHEVKAQHNVPIERACFGVAGPIRDQHCEATNLPWIINAQSLSKSLGGVPVLLINDLVATAIGAFALTPGDFEVLNIGTPHPQGNAAVLAAGTGLGQAGIFWDGERHHPFPSEGGHTSFAPANDLQLDLLRYLHRQFSHVSWERVLSGPGLQNIYHFLRDARGGDEPRWLADEMRAGDPAAAVSRAALAGKSELCVQALDLFVSIYGQEAGNVGLKFLATGGIFIGGGIAPKILPAMRSPVFLGAFLAKGRMRPVLEAMPVRVILNEAVGLIGAAVRAMEGN